jgi:uncharacterized protein (TIGR02996 family)
LLAAIAASPADDTPRRVLADYWIDHGDGDRGMFVQASCERLDAHVHAMLGEHGLHWFEPLWRAGFLHDRVEVDRGFLRPLAVPATSALLLDPSLFRMSPIVYRLENRTSVDHLTGTWEATRLTIAGEQGRATVRLRNPDQEHDVVGRERSILERFSNPAIPAVLDVAQAVTGTALVLPLFGKHLVVRGAVGESEVARLRIRLAHALADLHAVDVFHGRILRVEISTLGEAVLLDGLAHARCELPRSPIDVWALAMILVELAQGFHPTRARDSEFERLQAIHRMELELPIARTALGQVLMRGLVAEPERRLSAFELAEALEAFA